MNRRPAATLVEVLVAIFIMGIGLLAILALFPLGAIRMAAAIQDDRVAHISANAAAAAQALNLRNDTNVVNAALKPGGPLPAAVAGGPGYPVYIDPIGRQNSGQAWVGNNNTPGIPRIATANPATTGAAGAANRIRWFTFLEDIRFGKIGVPLNPLDRETNFSYAYMYRRPLMSTGAVTELAVVVYNRRPIAAAAGAAPANEPEFTAVGVNNTTFNPTSNTITFSIAAGQPKPALRAGTWVLDATVKARTPANPYTVVNSYFYRAVSVEETPANTFVIEVNTPLRNWAAAGTGRLILMEGVVEVFDKGTGWPQ
jgi:hypothetical protein